MMRPTFFAVKDGSAVVDRQALMNMGQVTDILRA